MSSLNMTSLSSIGGAGGAKLGPADSPYDVDYVSFQFNPASIAIAHTAPMAPSAGSGKQGDGTTTTATTINATDVDQLAKANGVTSISMRGVTFDGASVVTDCLRLLNWTHFAPIPDDPTGKKEALPRLKFIWGTQVYLVALNQVTINYTRFTPTGQPVRAQVDLTLHSIPKIPGPTNPSSGGFPGRRSHVLSGAETLPALATQCYGGPGRWREIAAANGFEDPLRVRPGTRVYLPSSQEGGR
jgi:nucleoid-associated protein YgaU